MNAARAHDDRGAENGRDVRAERDGDGSERREPARTRRLTPADLGVPRLGARATLVQFSSAFCQPCRATRRILDDVSGMVEGVRHVELDAEERLSLVRQLGVERTPTVLVLDAAGRVVRQAAGAPRKADVIAALGEAVDR